MLKRRTWAMVAAVVLGYAALVSVLPPPDLPTNADGMPCALPMAGCVQSR